MPHTLVAQLRFARSEFARCLEGVSEEEARQRLLPMNSISWTVGHLAAQEQDYFVFFPQGKVLHPGLSRFGFGQPASTPPLAEMWQLWRDVTAEADKFLDTVTEELLRTYLQQDPRDLEGPLFSPASKEVLARESITSAESVGTRIQRTTFHYFFHTGESHAIRQQLGHPDLPYFVGDMPDYGEETA